MPPEAFSSKIFRALEAVKEKADYNDDLDWEAFNERPEFTLGKGWSMDKFQRYDERWNFHSKCIFRHGRVILVEGATDRYAEVMEAARSMLRPAHSIPRAFEPQGTNRVIRFLTLGALHPSVARETPRLYVSVGEFQTLPELLSYTDGYFNDPNSKLQYLFVIKIYPPKQGEMVAVVYENVGTSNDGTVITSAVSFGDNELHPETLACLMNRGITVITGLGLGGDKGDSMGIPNYQLKFATIKVLEGAPLGPEEIVKEYGENFYVDLYPIKSAYNLRSFSF